MENQQHQVSILIFGLPESKGKHLLDLRSPNLREFDGLQSVEEKQRFIYNFLTTTMNELAPLRSSCHEGEFDHG